jgi:hypothetical protein
MGQIQKSEKDTTREMKWKKKTRSNGGYKYRVVVFFVRGTRTKRKQKSRLYTTRSERRGKVTERAKEG